MMFLSTILAQTCTDERTALTNIYTALGGPTWINSTHWTNPNVAVCGWFGVSCTNDGFVNAIDLSNNNLTGQIPDDIACLTFLKQFYMNNNKMQSNIPVTLCELQNLQYFQADAAGLVGALPACLCTMTNMMYFYAANNAISGQIPTCIGQMTFLREMHLYCDLITGTVPTGFNTLQYLIELRVQCNVGLDCTSDLTVRSNFIYLCGDFHCDQCTLTPNTCPAFIDIVDCGRYYRTV